MGYANYDKVQIFHMTCTCVTPLSTRDRLTGHVNRDARATPRMYIYVCMCNARNSDEFPGTRRNPSEIYATQRELHSWREGRVSWEPDYYEKDNEREWL